MTELENKIVARECRFAIHIPEKNGVSPDLHMVKEQVHRSDGSITPAIRLIPDFKRSVYVTSPKHRVYKQKREWSPLGELIERQVTQSQAQNTVARLLDKPWSKDHLKKLAQSPYLYGTDITSTSLLKKKYMDQFPNVNTPYTLATYDVETDVINGTEEIIMASVIFKQEVFIVVKHDFVKGIVNVDELLQQKSRKYIGEYLDKGDYKITLHIAKDVVEVIKVSFAKVHELKPDWLAIWNMDYDIPKILENLERYGEDPRDYLCDPSIPKHLRVCRYKQGTKKVTTASGKVKPKSPADQWHTLLCTASFYVIDAMCAYRKLRLGDQEESSYSLDNILAVKLGIRKLSFKEAEDYSGLRWHQVMQMNFKIEYMVYNIFDCLSMIELDNTTKDLQYTLPSFSATSDFSNFKSQPRRIADALHFYALENGYVMGTVASEDDVAEKVEVDPDDPVVEDEETTVVVEEDKVLDRRNWVLTLPPLNSVLGLPFIQEDPKMRTGIRAHVFDSDASAAYPSAGSVANVSKSTTKRELISIEGVDEDYFRMHNLNIVLGNVNAIEYATGMFGLPQPYELLEILK